MDLENLNLVELNAREIIIIDGGIDGYDCWCDMGDNPGGDLINFVTGIGSMVAGAAGYAIGSLVIGFVS